MGVGEEKMEGGKKTTQRLRDEHFVTNASVPQFVLVTDHHVSVTINIRELLSEH